MSLTGLSGNGPGPKKEPFSRGGEDGGGDGDLFVGWRADLHGCGGGAK